MFILKETGRGMALPLQFYTFMLASVYYSFQCALPTVGWPLSPRPIQTWGQARATVVNGTPRGYLTCLYSTSLKMSSTVAGTVLVVKSADDGSNPAAVLDIFFFFLIRLRDTD